VTLPRPGARVLRALVVLACVLVACVALLTRAGGAQEPAASSDPAATLARAVKLYEDLQVERAVALLRPLADPLSAATPAQRVSAYKYMGASLAILGARDSAVAAFSAAVARDPFLDLDPQTFTAAEREAFAQARRQTYRVAVRPVAAAVIDPRLERLPLVLVATHAGALRAELSGPGGRASLLYESGVEGARELAWAGVLDDGRLAPPGRYELLLRGQSALGGGADSARVYLDVRHQVEPLEDTLPALGPAQLLPERHPRAASTRALAGGAAVALAALAIPAVVGNSHLGGGGLAVGGAAAGLAGGGLGFLVRRAHPEIPANAAENSRRRADRARHNALVVERNAERRARTRLAIAPAAGATS
jgi:hypothetical protein